SFLLQHGGDDLLGLGTREAALAQEALAILVLAGDDLLASRPDARQKRRGRRRGEPFQRGRRLVREPMAGELAVADRDLLEALGAPDIAIHANGAEVEGRHAESLGAHLAVPAIEAAEVEVGVAIGEAAGFDRMG